jgi:hypothetical protein
MILVIHLKQEQVIMISDCVYLADLSLIPMKDMVVILGMDLLEENGAQIDCKEKTVSLRSPGAGRIVYQGDRHAHIEVQLQLNAMKEAKLEDIPVVNEFQYVFPQELPGMPPDREIEFTIDLIPETAPIAQEPYKMGPKELVELKEQLDELEQKGFIQKSISPWGTPVILWISGMEDAECAETIGTSTMLLSRTSILYPEFRTCLIKLGEPEYFPI